MQNHVTVIEHDPKTSGAALRLGAHFGFFAQSVLHVFGDGFDLRVRVAGADHKIIGEWRLPAHVERFDIVCFDFVAGAANEFEFLSAGGFELFSSFSDDFSPVFLTII